MRRSYIIGGAVAALAVVSTLGKTNGHGLSSPVAASALSYSTPIEPPPADFTMSAGDLLKAYRSDKLLARQSFQNKLLAITGVVSAINPGTNGGPVVYLSGTTSHSDNRPADLQATLLPSSAGYASRLVLGQSTTLFCSKFSETAGSAALEECDLQS